MSEFISMATKLHVDPRRIAVLVQVVIDYFDGQEIPVLKERLTTELGTISSTEMAYAVQVLADSEQAVGDDTFAKEHELLMHDLLDSVLALDSDKSTPPGHPVHTFMMENRAIAALVAEIRSGVTNRDTDQAADWLQDAMSRLWEVDIHYTRKELQLFPFLERAGFDRPSTVMWSVHDDIRAKIKQQRQHLDEGRYDDFRDHLDELLNTVENMVDKEEMVLYPTSLHLLDDPAWQEIRRGESEIGYCLIEAPLPWIPETSSTLPDITLANHASPQVPDLLVANMEQGSRDTRIGTIGVDGGALSPYEFNLLLKHLPMDITLVDEFDEVRFYNRGVERVFPRSAGIIGREVKYCHPPKSVHIVIEIVSEFKSGQRDTAEFWIQMKDLFIHIRYFAVRDAEGAYRGVLEVSQDVTHLRSETPRLSRRGTLLSRNSTSSTLDELPETKEVATASDWSAKIGTFETFDARETVLGGFLAMITSRADALSEDEGLHVIQSFEPIPLYAVLGAKGFVHHTEVVSDTEYHIYFYKTPVSVANETVEAASVVAAASPSKVSAVPFIATEARPSRVGLITLEEGALTPDQISLVLRHLPINVTYVDDSGRAQYSNHPRGETLLAQSGQDIAAFKEGTKDQVDTWSLSGDVFYHGRNIAIRDGGEYRGALLTTQDVNSIRALEGERRLLEWD